MATIKLLTIADGFGDSRAVPDWYPNYIKWPEIIQLMTRGVELHNLSRYGAGNEYMVNQLRHNIKNADVVLVQWAQPNRLDLLLDHGDDQFWQGVIQSDPVYCDNIVPCGGHRFWLSSGSTTSVIQQYHRTYIGMAQHQSRSQLWIEYAKLLLETHKIDYGFMLVEHSQYLDIDAHWICHEPGCGMNDFRHKSKYSDLDLGLVQPIPLVAFDFIKQYIMPSMDLPWRRPTEIDAVENMLYRHYQQAITHRYDKI